MEKGYLGFQLPPTQVHDPQGHPAIGIVLLVPYSGVEQPLGLGPLLSFQQQHACTRGWREKQHGAPRRATVG